ncbi:MAG TPA: ParB/RepB/Spo0J family partition protein [Polyangia bacterium]|nr:ParB/RepB/Spo0J family partition protein [Polyangia bacterium]
MSAPKRKALGRGLAALIPGASPSPAAAQTVSPSAGGRGEGLRTISIEEIHPSGDQPRQIFDDTRLTELADSIRTQGVIQPVIVRIRALGGYELVAGERRWRAAQRAGLHEIPAVIRDIAPMRAFEMAMVENLQRADLNPIEEAAGYQRLISDFGYTQETLAGRVGKDRTTVTNALRLLRLPESVRDLVVAGRISMGHARALLGLESADAMERLARRVAAREMSVRQVEALVRRERSVSASAPATAAPSASARDLGDRLARVLGTKVKVVESGPGRGHLEVHYHSLDQLDALIARFLPS